MEEQMFDISYENDKAEEVFLSIIHDTEPDIDIKTRIGFPSFFIYQRYEVLSCNAHCNDHIKAMDKNANLVIIDSCIDITKSLSLI